MAKLSVVQALLKAKSYVKRGEIEEAQKLYQMVLQAFPENKRAQRGLAALGGSKQSIDIPGPPQEAINQLVNLYNQGQLAAVIEQATSLTEQYPKAFVVWNLLGISAAQTGQLDKAILAFQRVTAIKPDYADAYNNMGIALKEQGNLVEAEEVYTKALSLKPDHVEAYYNMANVLKEQGKLDEAIASYNKALAIKPDYAEACNNMATALRDQGKFDEAIEALNKALAINSDFADAYYNMGNVLQDQGKLEEAIAACKTALAINPNYAAAYNTMGNALQNQDKLDEAIASFNKALSLKPDYAHAYNSMGNVFSSQGRSDEAIIAYKKALSFQPDHAVARAQKLHEQAKICDWTAISEEHDCLENLGIVGEAVTPFALLSLEDAPERHQLRSQKYAKTKFSQPAIAFPNPTLKKPTRLRIGYFSSDFNDHPVTHLITKMLSLHDREVFEVFAYSFGGMHSDQWRGKVIDAVDNFKDVTEMNALEIALLARQDNLDIAIDLNGYTKNSRPGIFAYRAAPIQISYLGIAMTMGTDFIDYLIADRISIPIETSSLYNEKIIYLPDCYQVSNNSINIESVSVDRSQMSLPDEGFVFCCFNQSFKITPSVFDIWMRVLRQTEGSVLWLYKSNEWAAQNLQKEATRRGVCNERLIFAERLPLEQHIARHKLADLFLDTFNFGAGATGNTALWAGLPLITKLGKGFTARVSASLLDAIGLPELITQTEREYENLILDLAKNPARLDTIKEKLKSNKFHTPLFDTEVFTKHIEEGYRVAFERFWDGKAPQSIYI